MIPITVLTCSLFDRPLLPLLAASNVITKKRRVRAVE